VCPEHIVITDNGIIPLKERIADDFYDPLKMVARKIFGTKKKKLPVLQGAVSKKTLAATPTAKKKASTDAE
jgi:hypothetical protein